jgi:NADH-quinone oxidoreductase subunit L
MINLLFLIPIIPLLGFAINGLFNRSLSKNLSGIIATGAVGLSFLLSLKLFFDKIQDPTPTKAVLYNWISTGQFNLDFAFLVDSLTSVFLCIITGIGFLIHLYSTAYMKEDDGFRRFFAYLNLFIFFMLILVMGDSFLMMFIGWEGVGLCSYLLIGFWFKNIEYSKAAKKAFIMNRVGDLGLILGMFLLYSQFDSLAYDQILDAQKISQVSPQILTLATILLFIGATGKSALIPLYTWLPDAMAGPTPVSALIHAATMVTAGIYMIARASLLFSATPITMEVILWIGLATSLLAATIGLYQNDIKKVLAYSTVSQLGLMFAALGVGGYTAAVFHVMTHAFFKALLFLGAGSVIHAMHHEQDIRNMGGLRKQLPITYITFLIGTIAISGIPPLSGFFSKDQILAELLFKKGAVVYGIGILISLMTTFYMFRMFYLTFFGTFRGSDEQKKHLHESPASMTLPLVVLAIFACIAGLIGFPHAIGESFGIHNWLDHFLENSVVKSTMHFSASQEWSMIGLVTSLVLITIFFAYNKFVTKGVLPKVDKDLVGVENLIYNKYYVDEAYEKVITNPLDSLSNFSHKFLNNGFIDRMVNGIGEALRYFGNSFREVQSGNLGSYLLTMVMAIIAILVVSML